MGRTYLEGICRIFGTLSTEFQHLLASLWSSWIRLFELLNSFKRDKFFNTCQGQETKKRFLDLPGEPFIPWPVAWLSPGLSLLAPMGLAPGGDTSGGGWLP